MLPSLFRFLHIPHSSHAEQQYVPLASMPSSIHKDEIEDEEGRIEDVVEHESAVDPDAEYGGSEERKKLEKKLLWKLDARMSILIVIYILNYVRLSGCHSSNTSHFTLNRLTGIMPVQHVYEVSNPIFI